MKINKIKKMNNGKYKIELEGNTKITTYDHVILKSNILFNKEMDLNTLNNLEIETKYYDTYNRALKYIMTKMRSRLELGNYLEKLEISKEEQEKVIQELTERGFLNDEQYVKSFIADKIHLTNLGPNKIKNELLNHNIDANIIISELANYDESLFKDKIEKIVNKKVNSNNKYSNYILKQKIVMELINLGYDIDMINSCIESTNQNEDNIIEKEFNILKRKLEKKYKGQDLKFQLKNKLYKKGFSLDMINEIIEKR